MKCCFCGKDIDRKNAHNPEDFGLHLSKNDTYCCETCNMFIVIPNRILKSDYVDKGLRKETCDKLMSYFSNIKNNK